MFIWSGHAHHLVALLSLTNASLSRESESVLSELKNHRRRKRSEPARYKGCELG